MIDRQLELGFTNQRTCRRGAARQRRINQAGWWFARMRQVVDSAFDWRTPPAPRPEQICFANAYRRPMR